MKIISVKLSIPQKIWGADVSNLARLNQLRQRGHRVAIHVLKPEHERQRIYNLILERQNIRVENDYYQLDGIDCYLHFNKKPEDLLEDEGADLVWVNHYDQPLANLEGNVWVAITEGDFVRRQEIKNILVASTFVKNAARRVWPKAHVIYLPNPIKKRRVETRNPQSLLFINTIAEKGLYFMGLLSRRMPQEDFIFVQNGNKTEIASGLWGNINVIPRQENLDPIFAMTKALLMPSICNEGFGRVAMEAMSAGIPVIGSDRGALPETIGEGGINLPFDLDDWEESIKDREVLKSKKPLDRFLRHRDFTEKAFNDFNYE